MIKKVAYYFLCLLFLNCTQKNETDITIAAASNMQFVLKELCKEFSLKTSKKCAIVLGSSGKLTSQIQQGAPFDIFLSANLNYPNTLFKENLTLEPPKVFGFGKLVLVYDDRLQIHKTNDLITSNIKHIALANPKTAPYGKATLEMLAFNKLDKQLASKLVYGESVSQVNQFITSKAVEVGFTSISSLKKLKTNTHWLEIPQYLYSPIKHGIVILKNNTDIETSKQFCAFIMSEEGQKVLEKFGYIRKKQKR